MKFLTATLLTISTSVSLATEAAMKKAFYNWSEVAQHALGPGPEAYVNIEAFKAIHEMGRPARDFILRKADQDRLNSLTLRYAAMVLGGQYLLRK